MKRKIKTQFELDLQHSLKRMWIIALCIGAAATVLVMIWKDRAAHWVPIAAMIAGALIGLALEIRKDVEKRKRTRLLAISLEQQKLAAHATFARVYIEGSYWREKQYREATVNGPGSMKRQPAFAG
jgi:lysylphosphatidylglycerol synthetase-like protein (DUF2156 family)